MAVLISDKYKFLFVHIPKNGGTLFMNLFSKPCQLNILVSNSGGLQDIPDDKADEIKDYLVVSAIRNPYTRLISLYRYREIEKVRKQYKNIDKFYQDEDNEDHILINQNRYVFDDRFANHATMTFENYENDLTNFAAHIGFFIPDIPKNREQRYYGEYNYKDYMTNWFYEFVKDKCDIDFAQFGYSKDPHDGYEKPSYLMQKLSPASEMIIIDNYYRKEKRESKLKKLGQSS